MWYNAGMERMNEPTELAVGVRVFTPYPANLRRMNPEFDTGTIVMFNAPFTHVWVEKKDAFGKKYKTPYPVGSVEAIG